MADCVGDAADSPHFLDGGDREFESLPKSKLITKYFEVYFFSDFLRNSRENRFFQHSSQLSTREGGLLTPCHDEIEGMQPQEVESLEVWEGKAQEEESCPVVDVTEVQHCFVSD